MTDLHLSRVRLKTSAHAGTLASLLLDPDRADAPHKLVWSLFSETGAETRDFRFRQIDDHAFLILSPRPPVDRHALFDIETKPFRPALAAGQTWRFALRANAVVSRPRGPNGKQKRDDVVMAALHAVPRDERAAKRRDIVRSAGLAWLIAQGARNGFALARREETDPDRADAPGIAWLVDVDGYDQINAPRPGKEGPIRLSLIDFEGMLTVTDPALFTRALERGLGKAKAFGAGLLLIRPA